MRADGTCRRCGGAIVWTVTEAFKKMPVDPVPRAWPEGKITVAEAGGVLRSRVAKERPEDGNGYLPHAATCSTKGTWRPKGSRR